MLEYIKSICHDDIIVCNDRHAISPYEIDVLDKTRMIGFEFDGLYWHSQLAGSRLSLLAKTYFCEVAGITLVHVLEDEWDLREEQCKARIRQTLGLHDDCMKITSFKRLGNEEADVFLERNSYDLFAKHST